MPMAASTKSIGVQTDYISPDDMTRAMFSSVSEWHEAFYSNPSNCAAYAAWCRENDLEYDLPTLPEGT